MKGGVTITGSCSWKTKTEMAINIILAKSLTKICEVAFYKLEETLSDQHIVKISV